MTDSDAIQSAVDWYVAGEEAHQQDHRDHGLTERWAVSEQQTGHRVCAWCGYCEGGCGGRIRGPVRGPVERDSTLPGSYR